MESFEWQTFVCANLLWHVTGVTWMCAFSQLPSDITSRHWQHVLSIFLKYQLLFISGVLKHKQYIIDTTFKMSKLICLCALMLFVHESLNLITWYKGHTTHLSVSSLHCGCLSPTQSSSTPPSCRSLSLMSSSRRGEDGRCSTDAIMSQLALERSHRLSLFQRKEECDDLSAPPNTVHIFIFSYSFPHWMTSLCK